jgi:hypothetical protein
MRYVLLAIFVLLASQPVQVTACDMHDARQNAQHGTHDMGHGGGQKMDCCDHDPGMPPDHCNPVFHCGAQSVGVMAFNALTVSVMFVPGDPLDLPDTGDPLSNFSPPPFKPPIV